MSQAPADESSVANRHLWELKPLRDLAAIAAFVLAAVLLYTLRAATLPLALAFLLAYVADPFVSYCERRLGAPRAVTTLLCIALLLVTGLAAIWFALPRVTSAFSDFAEDAPRYLEVITQKLALEAQLVPGAEANGIADLLQSKFAVDSAVGAMGVATDIFGATTYLLVASIFTLMMFGYFSMHFGDLPSLRQFIPNSQRARIWSLVEKLVAVFGAYVRGQLLVAVFTSIVFATGFSIIGVPHAIVAALLGGLLSFIPNGQASGWLCAILFSVLGQGADFDWVSAIVYPTLVYAISQSLETFVITPLVQGSYTRLHPLAVLTALLCGASVGGVFGILVAIPLMACARIVLLDVVAPSLRHKAAQS